AGGGPATVEPAVIGGEVARAAPPVDAWEPLEVTATSASLVIPVLGETVRYQHLLLDADDDSPITLYARRRSP
ncbi:MAG TPA: hypothetical protein PKA64_10735, partial [Myxococcota bacterium]|nr:hypothetical protein [Myxococcota bacterium]